MSTTPYTDPTRPGQPSGEPWWWPVLLLAILAASSVIGLVALGAVAWLAWYLRVYLIGWFSISVATTAVVYVFYLLTRRDWRPRTTGVTLLVALALFVLWVVSR